MLSLLAQLNIWNVNTDNAVHVFLHRVNGQVSAAPSFQLFSDGKRNQSNPHNAQSKIQYVKSNLQNFILFFQVYLKTILDAYMSIERVINNWIPLLPLNFEKNLYGQEEWLQRPRTLSMYLWACQHSFKIDLKKCKHFLEHFWTDIQMPHVLATFSTHGKQNILEVSVSKSFGRCLKQRGFSWKNKNTVGTPAKIWYEKWGWCHESSITFGALQESNN